MRTWGRRGQRPVLQETFNWHSLSRIAGLTLWRFYFRAYAGSIKSPPVWILSRGIAKLDPNGEAC